MSELLDVIGDLRASLAELRRRCDAQLLPPAMAKLTAAVVGLGQDRPAKPPVCPEEYLNEWKATRSGGKTPLPPRALRYLCWEPFAVLDPQFHHHIDEQRFALGSRGLQGLVRACHLRWSAYLADDAIQRIAMRNLRAYQGPNQI